MIVCLDAGHGGRDGGAFASERAFPDFPPPREKDYTLTQTLVAGSFCMARGLDVHLTRDRDIALSLRERVRIANEAGAGAFVSIHWNSAGSAEAPDGTIVLYASDAAEPLARYLLEAVGPLDREADRHERLWRVPDGVEGSRWETATPTVLARTDMPAAILEVEFASNPEEARRMLSVPYQIAVGRAIADALVRFGGV